MKANILLITAIMAVSSLSVYAQPQNARPYMGKSPQEIKRPARPDGFSYYGALSEEQRAEIKKIRTEQTKERTQIRYMLKEKQAKLEVLQTADKPDMKEINKTIDEIASIRAKEMKNQAAARQKIRSLLTEEQRIHYDAFGTNKGYMQTEHKPHFRGQRGHFRGQRGDWNQPRRDRNKENINN